MHSHHLRSGLLIALIAASTVLLISFIVWIFYPPGATPDTPSAAAVSAALEPPLFEYIEIIGSCGPYSEGVCVNARAGPGEEYPVVTHLRTGVVLKTSGKVERNGRMWYAVVFDEWLRYPERARSELYVAADFVTSFLDEGPQEYSADVREVGTKRILVDRSEQTLYAYDGDALFMQEKISSGLEFTPTPRGTFTIFRKTPSRYMQGPIPEISDKSYDLPGVPWNLYFTKQGAVIHGAYWHDHFGTAWSNGCVNLPPEKAKELYRWADLGTQVIVRD